MQQEPPDELLGRESHFAFLVAASIVPPAESDLIAVKGNQTMIGNGHTMGITPQVTENLVRATKGRFGIDDPLVPVEFANELGKAFRFRQMLDEAGKVQAILIKGILQSVDELSAENLLKQLQG